MTKHSKKAILRPCLDLFCKKLMDNIDLDAAEVSPVGAAEFIDFVTVKFETLQDDLIEKWGRFDA